MSTEKVLDPRNKNYATVSRSDIPVLHVSLRGSCIWFLCRRHYIQFKVWLKTAAEQTFLYGHHVMKSGLGRITENTEQYQGVLIYNMSDMPLVSQHKTPLIL